MHYLIEKIIQQLEIELATAIASSQQAHSSATHSENVADNKYDTLATEAAYLAHGQSMRVAELQQSILLYRRFNPPAYDSQSTIGLGALVEIETLEPPVTAAQITDPQPLDPRTSASQAAELGQRRRLFLGPAAGGLLITGVDADIGASASANISINSNTDIQLITAATPLGRGLLDKGVDDEFVLTIQQQSQCFRVVDIQ